MRNTDVLLVSDNNELASEWNYEKNVGILPQDYSCGSNRKVWWICAKGHEWEAIIANRAKGRGCPYCANRKVLKGYNDLQTVNPGLAAEWDYEKNGDLTPQMVTQHSGKRAWWRCEKGHSWQASIDNRSKGKGCPVCRNKRVLKGYNDLLTVDPKLASEWDYEKNGELSPDLIGVGSEQKVWWKCEKGHSWCASVYNRHNGSGCPYCYKRFELPKQNKKTHNQFMSELALKNPLVEVLGAYEGANKPLQVRCKKCGFEWTPIAASVLRGTGCPRCAGNNKRTHEDFITQLEKVNPIIEVLEQYINTDAKIKVRCKDCDTIWYTSPNNLLDGHGCPRCSKRKTHQEFLDALSRVNPDVEVLGQYTDYKTHIAVRCKKCGYEWKSKPSQLLGGHGCHKCAIKKQADQLRKTHKQFEAELADINPDIVVTGSYVNYATSIEVKCKKCEYVWNGLPGNLLKGQGCPRCASYLHTSYPEQAIFYYIQKAFPDAINSYRELFDKRMELDIFIPSERVGIEYDGSFWHASGAAYEREVKKYSICRENNIRLIRVKELQQDNDSLTADDVLYTEATLEDTISKVAVLLGVDFDIDLERDKSEIFAQYKGMDMNEEFIKRLSVVNPDVIPLSRYTLSSIKIECRCVKCGYEWSATPNTLLRGSACPKCAGRMKKSTKQFEEELKKINSQIEVIGEYTKAFAPVLVRCRKCAYEWAPVAASLLRGNGCPKCSKRLRISHEQFVEELRNVNLDIEVLGDYKAKRIPILVKCRKCGREWSTTPDNLLRGHGCAKCAGQLKKTTEEFAKELKAVNERFRVVGEYVNARTKIKVVCADCGFERIAVPYSLMKGLRCPLCDRKNLDDKQ